MSQIFPEKDNLNNLGLNQVHLVCVVPVWMGCYMAYNFLLV